MFFCFVLLLLGHAKTLEDCFTQPCFITCGPAQWNSFKIIFFPFEIFGFCLVSHPFSKLDTTHSIISETLTQPLLVLQPRPHSDNTTANNCFLMKKHNIHAQFCAVLKRCGSDVHWAFCRPILAYFPRQYIGIYSVCSPVEKLSTPNNSVACSTTLSAITSTNLLHDFICPSHCCGWVLALLLYSVDICGLSVRLRSGLWTTVAPWFVWGRCPELGHETGKSLAGKQHNTVY